MSEILFKVDGHFPPITKKADYAAVRGPGDINAAQTVHPVQKVNATLPHILLHTPLAKKTY